MKIVIGAAPDEWFQTLKEALGALNAGVQRYEHGQNVPDNEKLLLVYCRPEYTVEAAIEAQEDIKKALDAWVMDSGALLDVFRKNRGRVVLVHGPTVFQYPDGFSDVCNLHFGVAVPSESLVTPFTEPQEDRGLRGVIAAQVVSTSFEITDLAGQLEAAAIPLAQDPPIFVADWLKAYEELRGFNEKLKENAEEIERVTLRVRAKEEELKKVKAGLKAEKENLQQVKELEEENELLLLQLHQVQEELEQYYLEAKELRERQTGASLKDLDALLTYSVQLEHQYSKLLKSRTWKVMAPIREAGRILKSILRRKRVPRNRLPKRPEVLAKEPLGGRYGKRTVV